MSRSYTVKAGDTLVKVSTKEYGTYKNWRKILAANHQLTGRKTSYDGVPLLYPGDVLFIPSDVEEPEKTVEKTEEISDNVSEPSVEDAREKGRRPNRGKGRVKKTTKTTKKKTEDEE